MEFNFAEKVTILGQDYAIEVRKVEDDKVLKKRHLGGYCASPSKRIIVRDRSSSVELEMSTEEDALLVMKSVLRHEIVHAFLNESGLSQEAARCASPWSLNEEMVDWIAIQGPKIYKAWLEAGAL